MADEPSTARDPRARRPEDFPYRSRLLAGLSALILLWESPTLQSEILTRSGEAIDQPSHQALRHLLAWGPMRPSALAEALGTGASNVSKIVGRLERAALVERATDPSDTRATLVSLTDAGTEAARHVYALGDDMIREVLASWSEEDVATLTALTERFVDDAIEAAEHMRRRGLQRP
ncbi:MarR family winged helix-turn-helix transcriptional regulator [Nocardioides sp. CPCC 205120]|uniref:MarR family winged helix-turn-helix transcriptional regulator n=1 Tax=Nocardioides sp. CPCC 205120 TaxID=3406462 RepID=UPI003B511BF6